MSYVVHLYVEGGDNDGETRIAGPFDFETEAQTTADRLSAYGTAEVCELLGSADAVEDSIA